MSRDYSDSSSDVVIVNPSNHVRRVSLQSINHNDTSRGPIRVNIPGSTPDAARDPEETNPSRPVATISPFIRDETPNNEVFINRDLDPRLRNQSAGSSHTGEDVLRFPNGQPIRDGPLNTCDSYTSSGGRNQCHIAKGTTCNSFREKWENREKEMAGIGIGKYATGDVRDQDRGINNNHLDPKPGPSKPKKSKPGRSGPPKSLDEALSNFYQGLPPLPSPPVGTQKGLPESLNPQCLNQLDQLPLPSPPPRVQKELTNQISRKIPESKLLTLQKQPGQSKPDQTKIDKPTKDHPTTDQPKTGQWKIDQPKIDQSKKDQPRNDQKGLTNRAGHNQVQPRLPGSRPGPRVGHCFKRSQWRPNTWAPPQPHYFVQNFQPIWNYQPIMRPGPNRPMGWQQGFQQNQRPPFQNDHGFYGPNGQGPSWYPRHGHPPVRQFRPHRPPQNPHWSNHDQLKWYIGALIDTLSNQLKSHLKKILQFHLVPHYHHKHSLITYIHIFTKQTSK